MRDDNWIVREVNDYARFVTHGDPTDVRGGDERIIKQLSYNSAGLAGKYLLARRRQYACYEYPTVRVDGLMLPAFVTAVEDDEGGLLLQFPWLSIKGEVFF